MALKILSWVAVVLGVISILQGLADASHDSEYMYAVIGGGMFLAQGVLSLDYMRKHPETK